MRRPSRRRRGGVDAERRWFAALCAASAAPAYRAALAATEDEERAARAVERGFRDAWRRRSRRPVGRLASDWTVALVTARAGVRHIRPLPIPDPWVAVPPPAVLDALAQIPLRPSRLRGAITGAGVVAGVFVLAGIAGLTVGLAAVLR